MIDRGTEIQKEFNDFIKTCSYTQESVKKLQDMISQDDYVYSLQVKSHYQETFADLIGFYMFYKKHGEKDTKILVQNWLKTRQEQKQNDYLNLFSKGSYSSYSTLPCEYFLEQLSSPVNELNTLSFKEIGEKFVDLSAQSVKTMIIEKSEISYSFRDFVRKNSDFVEYDLFRVNSTAIAKSHSEIFSARLNEIKDSLYKIYSTPENLFFTLFPEEKNKNNVFHENVNSFNSQSNTSNNSNNSTITIETINLPKKNNKDHIPIIPNLSHIESVVNDTPESSPIDLEPGVKLDLSSKIPSLETQISFDFSSLEYFNKLGSCPELKGINNNNNSNNSNIHKKRQILQEGAHEKNIGNISLLSSQNIEDNIKSSVNRLKDSFIIKDLKELFRDLVLFDDVLFQAVTVAMVLEPKNSNSALNIRENSAEEQITEKILKKRTKIFYDSPLVDMVTLNYKNKTKP